MTVTDKITALRRAMLESQLDAYIVPSTDPHQSEYPAPRWAAREWLSGFTGSSGTLVVTLHEARLWTDSRYFIQAEAELAGSGISIMPERVPNAVSIEDWLGSTLLAGQNVGADGRVISVNTARRMRDALAKKDLQLLLDEDLIRRIWTQRPAVPHQAVFEHAAEFSGESWQARLEKMAEWVRSQGLGYYVVTALDELAWLLNLRGSDIEFNPLCVAYLVVGSAGDHALFAAPRPGFTAWTEAPPVGHQLEVYEYDKISSYLRRINALDADVGLDAATCSARLYLHAGEDRTETIPSPIPGWKAIKNDVALDHLRQTMRHDAVALLRLFRWLPGAIVAGVDEAGVAEHLTGLRAEQPHYVTDSFNAIVGYGGNGAIVHYHAPASGSATLRAEGLLLLDSGGQYLSGTTDITRTVALGPTTEEMRRDFTLVLQGHIDLAMARFPRGTSGAQLDILARQALWQVHQDYGHGTGHGVGFFLNVHEGPASISQQPKSPNTQYPLEPGMVLSNEPGFYRTGAYGLRVENLVAVVPAAVEGWLEFETLTLFPIDQSLIIREMLTAQQLAWVNAYHSRVLAEVGSLLEGDELAWLEAACTAL